MHGSKKKFNWIAFVHCKSYGNFSLVSGFLLYEVYAFIIDSCNDCFAFLIHYGEILCQNFIACNRFDDNSHSVVPLLRYFEFLHFNNKLTIEKMKKIMYNVRQKQERMFSIGDNRTHGYQRKRKGLRVSGVQGVRN